MTRYTMPARSQGKTYAQRREVRAERDDVHRWVFVHSLTSEVEYTVRKWLATRLNGFHCELQLMYTPQVRSISLTRTHIVLNNTPRLNLVQGDEAVEVDARGLSALEAVRALMKATGLNPHLSVCGWPFCLDDLGGVDDMERGTI